MRTFLLALAALAWFSVARPSMVYGEELRVQPTPFSVWLDFDRLRTPSPTRLALPIWIESVQDEPLRKQADTPQQTVFRIRLRRMPQLHSDIQLRVFFEDREGASPVVTGWTETGNLRYESMPLGNGLNLQSSASLTIPVDGLDYIDVTVPGDGSNVRGVFAASLHRIETHAAIDFATPTALVDPFGDQTPAAPASDDLYLFGRVKATLEAGTVKLERGTGTDSVTWEVQFDAPPMAALVTFEVLGVDISLPPDLSVNEQPLGAVNLQLPDLADPGFRGDVRPLERDMRFRYTGWLRCQKLVPGSTFNSGLNRIRLRLNSNSGPVAVRAVEVQLKYHWQDFDYTLSP